MSEVDLYVLIGNNLQMLIEKYSVQNSVISMFPYVFFLFL